MVSVDLKKVKKFLKQENGDEKLNLNALTLVGTGGGAILAVNFAVVDFIKANVIENQPQFPWVARSGG